MLKMMCEDLSFILVKNRIISEEDRDIYIYGLELLLNGLLVIGTIILLGVLFNKILITGVFLLIFCSLRMYSGGYHANQYWKCFCIGCSAYLMVIYFVLELSMFSNNTYALILLIVSYAGIILIGPLNSKKNPKSEEEMKKNSRMTKALATIYTLIATVGTFALSSASELWLTIILTQLTVTIFLMVAIFQRRVLK